MPAEAETERVHCNGCGRDTNHAVLAKESASEGEKYGDVWVGYEHVYTLLRCLGCDAVSLRQQSWFTEDDRDTPPRTTFFPARASRKPPAWIDELPDDTGGLLREIYAALYSDSRRLALMGTRTTLDTYILRKVGDVGTFRQKLEALKRNGHISADQLEPLEACLDAGSAAAHRGHLPTAAALNFVLDILENLLHLETLTPSTAAFRSSVPPRPGRSGTNPQPGSGTGG